MIKKFVALSVIVCLCASAASARDISSKGGTISLDSFRGATAGPGEAGELVDVDLSGVTTWDFDTFSVLDPENLATVITIIPATAGDFNGVSWDTISTTTSVGSGLSWGSEMIIAFDTDNDPSVIELQLTTSGTGAPITSEANTSGGVLKLVDAGIAAIPHNGTIDLYFYESYDDNVDAADGLFEAGSTISIQTAAVPEPAAMGMLLLAGLSALVLRRRS